LLFGNHGPATLSRDGGQSFAPITDNAQVLQTIADWANGKTLKALPTSFPPTKLTSTNPRYRTIGGRSIGSEAETISNKEIILSYEINHLKFFPSKTTLTSSKDGGRTFRNLPTDNWPSFEAAISVESDFLFFGQQGIIVRVDSSKKGALSALHIENGTRGDSTLADFLDSELPKHVQGWPPVQGARLSLSLIESRREVLTALGRETQKKLNAHWNEPELLKREEVKQAFEDFLETCRGKNTDPELTQSCLEGWRVQRDNEVDNWWRTLAVQVPPGVLLLFLLSTLSALYRYSLRMSGFYHSRADALELLQAGLDEKQKVALTALATDLAADKVEFGKANTPTDQAVELAKAISGK